MIQIILGLHCFIILLLLGRRLPLRPREKPLDDGRGIRRERPALAASDQPTRLALSERGKGMQALLLILLRLLLFVVCLLFVQEFREVLGVLVVGDKILQHPIQNEKGQGPPRIPWGWFGTGFSRKQPPSLLLLRWQRLLPPLLSPRVEGIGIGFW